MLKATSLARSYAQAVTSSVLSAGLYPTIRADLAGWVEVMKRAPGMTIVNPAFDPDVCDVGPDNAFWIEVATPEDEVVACIASKHFPEADFLELYRSCNLWLGTKPRLVERMDLVVPEDTPEIRGSVSFYGGLWVHPDYRKIGLSAALPRLARAVSVQRFQPDWHCGTVFGGIGDSGLAKWSYGYEHVVQATDCYFPLTRRHERLFLPYETADEWYACASEQLGSGILPGDHQLVDLVARPGQRKDQAVAV